MGFCMNNEPHTCVHKTDSASNPNIAPAYVTDFATNKYKTCTSNYNPKCIKGQSSKTPSTGECPAGYYCDSGSYKPKPCAIGTYSTSKKLTAASACTDCPVGSFCTSHAMSSAPGDPANACEAGYYCETKNSDKF